MCCGVRPPNSNGDVGGVLATPHIAGVTIRRKKPNVNDVKIAPADRMFLNRHIYLISIFLA